MTRKLKLFDLAQIFPIRQIVSFLLVSIFCFNFGAVHLQRERHGAAHATLCPFTSSWRQKYAIERHCLPRAAVRMTFDADAGTKYGYRSSLEQRTETSLFCFYFVHSTLLYIRHFICFAHIDGVESSVY